MTQPIRFAMFVLVGSAHLLAGCNGGDEPPAPSGPSYSDQFRSALRISDPAARSRKLVALAIKQHQAKDTGGAKKSIAEASKAARQVDDAISKPAVYTRLAEGQAAVGEVLAASGSIKTAIASTENLSDPLSRASQLCSIARTQAEALDNPDGASSTLKECRALAETMTDVPGKVNVLASAAKVYAKIDRQDQAQQLIQSGFDVIAGADNLSQKVQSLADLAAAQHAIGETEKAIATLKTARGEAANIEAVQPRVYRMADVATVLAEVGKRNDAQALLKEADDLTMQIPQPDQQESTRKHVRKLRDEL